MLPFQICLTACGFYTLQVKNTKIKYTVTSYCCLFAVLFIVHSVTFISYILQCHNSQCGLTSVTHGLAEFARTTMLTCYCVKFVVQADAVSDVERRIDCVDERLVRIGVKAPYVTEPVERTIFTVILFVVCVVRAVLAVFVWIMSPTKTRFYPRAYVLPRMVVNTSTQMLLTHCVLLLYRVKEKMSRLCCAAEKIENIFARKTAWNNVVALSLEDVPVQKENYLIEIRKIYNCMFIAFQGIIRFYNQYFILNVIFFILKMSVLLFTRSIEIISSYIIFLVAIYTLLVVALLILCVTIRLQFQTVQTLMNKFYWSNKFRRFNPRGISVTEWSIQCIRRDQTFGCGYFDADLNVLATVFDLLSLLLFAM